MCTEQDHVCYHLLPLVCFFCKYSFLPLWGFFLRFIFGHVCLYFTIDGREVGRKQEERARGGGGGVTCAVSTQLPRCSLCLCVSVFNPASKWVFTLHYSCISQSIQTASTLTVHCMPRVCDWSQYWPKSLHCLLFWMFIVEHKVTFFYLMLI